MDVTVLLAMIWPEVEREAEGKLWLRGVFYPNDAPS